MIRRARSSPHCLSTSCPCNPHTHARAGVRTHTRAGAHTHTRARARAHTRTVLRCCALSRMAAAQRCKSASTLSRVCRRAAAWCMRAVVGRTWRFARCLFAFAVCWGVRSYKLIDPYIVVSHIKPSVQLPSEFFGRAGQAALVQNPKLRRRASPGVRRGRHAVRRGPTRRLLSALRAWYAADRHDFDD